MRILITLGEVIILAALGAGVGFGANWLRGEERIIVKHAYFRPRASNAPSDQPTGRKSGVKTPPGSDSSSSAAAGGAVETTSGEADGAAAAAGAAAHHLAHEFQTINTEQIEGLLEDAEAGYPVAIIDARGDGDYEEGHIPGALQCDPYQPTRFLPLVKSYVTSAEKIIVYCAGGNCEDSVEVCRTLEFELFVERARLYLYEGGWHDWSDRGLRFEKGRPNELEESNASGGR